MDGWINCSYRRVTFFSRTLYAITDGTTCLFALSRLAHSSQHNDSSRYSVQLWIYHNLRLIHSLLHVLVLVLYLRATYSVEDIIAYMNDGVFRCFLVNQTRQFRENCYTPTCLWFFLCPRYLFNEIRFFYFHTASKEFPAVIMYARTANIRWERHATDRRTDRYLAHIS